MNYDFRQVLDEAKAFYRTGRTMEQLLPYLHQNGCSVVETVHILKEVDHSISLGEILDAIRASALWDTSNTQ